MLPTSSAAGSVRASVASRVTQWMARNATMTAVAMAAPIARRRGALCTTRPKTANCIGMKYLL
jgi:hypothetical protein